VKAKHAMIPKEKLKVAVLMGGDSAEREISLSTGRQVLDALNPEKYDARPVDARGLGQNLTALLEPRPDVVFIALHGPHGEDGAVQGLLDWLGLPYTGSGVLASALAMDKALSKKLFRAEGIPAPWSVVVTSDEPENTNLASLAPPLVVKPNRQGSSLGMTIVHETRHIREAIRLALEYDNQVLVEEFIEGTEITVSVLGNSHPFALPVLEIIPKAEFYDYASKYEVGGSRHIIPARISQSASRKALDYARRAHVLLGCRGMSRTDFIVRGDEPVVLEINTIPGMTPTSLLPDAARAEGISFPELISRLISSALEV